MQQFQDFGPMLTYSEGIKSDTGRRWGIDNTPTIEQYCNMVLVYQHIYLPLCIAFGKLPVTSFFRCKKLNTKVGGSKTSQHMEGRAIDIDCDSLKTITNLQLFDYIREHMDYDQIGLEYPDKNGNPGWVHVSWVGPGMNRKALFKAT